jgi:6-phosphogluconolactonase
VISIQTFPDPAAVAKAAARFIYNQVSALHDKNRFLLALSGGNTPKLMYEELLKIHAFGAMIRSKGEFFFSDERAVPPESEQSNYHTAKIGLFEPLQIENKYVHRMRGEIEDLANEARQYEDQLRRIAGVRPNEIPQLDIVMLGMGPDGHTASLFPDYDFTTKQTKLVDAPFVKSLKSYRLTFTLTLLNAARMAIVVACGADKAPAVKKVLSATIKGDILPARRVEAQRTLWMLDTAAASQLDPASARGSIEVC